MFIDTHCHLDLFDNPQEILEQSRVVVDKFILPTINSKSLLKSKKIADENIDVFLAAGIHPEETKKDGFDLDKEVKSYNIFLEENNKKIVGIGECGLDIDKDNSNLNIQSLEINIKLQLQLFKQHADWSEKYDKPLIIHNRRGNEYFKEILQEKNLNGVFHCYAMGRKFIKTVLDFGFYFGIGGILTLDEGLQRVVKDIPMDRIILETDSPFLTPKQVRDKKTFPNIPVNVKYVAETLAEIKGLNVKEIEKITNNNVERLFQI